MIVLLTIVASATISLISGFGIEFLSKKSINERPLDLSLFGAFIGILGALLIIWLSGDVILQLPETEILILMIIGILVGPAISSFLGQAIAMKLKSRTKV